ncbi:transporter substrate-binding domain-containing protein [Aestuariivirga sp.]|uniref:transporter substrate-binding domain-containing protein n=1 Tax=Aestuariivirga sp. TaxID=2650926 RepID=UPI00391AA60E
MNWTRRLALGVAAAALLATAAPAMADLRFGVAAEPYPPFTSKDASGKWVGWEIDVMDAVCAEMKEKCEVVEVAWDGIIPALTSKQIDVIWSSMLITEKRKETIDFSQMYYDTPPAMIGQKDGDKDISPEHLKGKTLGVQVSTGHERYAQKYLLPAGVDLKTYATQDEANNDLAAGRLDYVLANSSALFDYLGTDQGSACCELKGIIEKPKDDPGIYGEGVGGGVRKEDTALKEKLNAAISALAKAGKFDEITQKYPQLVGKMTLPKAE